MLLQIEVGKELQFLAYLLPVIIGIQLAFYFFYQYRKIQDITLPLNRILLAFGSFIIFIIVGPLLIQISRNIFQEGFLYDFFLRMGWFFSFFSTISISGFIIRHDFSTIINLNIAKILMVLNLIPIIMVFIVPSINSPFFIASIIFVVLNGLYILRFQLILIKRSVGNIKNKFRFFFIGAVVSLFALFFAALVGLGILAPIINEIIYSIGVGELLIGFIIICFSVYNFPPFYEFEWRKNLLKLFIINEQTNSCLFSYDFIEIFNADSIKSQKRLNQYDKFFTKGILGIESVIKTITGTKNEKINKINQEGGHIFLEYGTSPPNILYILVVEKDLISTLHLLKSIRLKFETFFKEILLDLEHLMEEQEKIFSSFDKIINQILQE